MTDERMRASPLRRGICKTTLKLRKSDESPALARLGSEAGLTIAGLEQLGTEARARRSQPMLISGLCR